jgi:hypothetical protein
MEEIDTYRKELLSVLGGVVDKLFKIVAGIPSSAWYLPFGQTSHTPHYTLAHLRVLEVQVFAIQLRRILDEETPLLSVFDDDAWMAKHYRSEEPTSHIMEDFVNLRKEELNWLRELHPEAWSRTARHPWWGVHTLQWWVELQMDYSDQHLRELSPLLDM